VEVTHSDEIQKAIKIFPNDWEVVSLEALGFELAKPQNREYYPHEYHIDKQEADNCYEH
jgi:hypothetical protein